MTILFLLNATRLIGYAGTDPTGDAVPETSRPVGGNRAYDRTRTDEQQAGAGETTRRATAGRNEGRRRRAPHALLQLGAGAVFLAIVAVVVLIVVNSGSSDSGGDASNIEDAAAVDEPVRRHPAAGAGPRRPRGESRTDRVRRPAVPGLQSLLRKKSCPPIIEGQVRDGEAKLGLPQLHDHRRRSRRRPAPRRSPPATRAAAGTSSSSSTATRASRTPATPTTSSSPRSPKRPASRTSPNGTRNARARSSTDEVEADDRRSRAARLHRHAVVRDQRPEHRRPRTARHAREPADSSKKRSKAPAEA